MTGRKIKMKIYKYSFNLIFAAFFSWIKELQKELFNVRQYNKHARPISNDSEQVIKVDMQFSFVRAVLNEKDSTLETDGWLGMVR
jgi:hypothetical protein